MKTIDYDLTIELTEPMLGTVAKDPEVYKSFIETKKPDDQKDQEFLSVEKAEEKGWTGFRKDDKGLFLLDYMIRGFLKAAGKATKHQTGLKAYKSNISQFLFVFPRRIRILDENGEMLQEPDDNLQRPLRAETAQGPRVTVAKSDIVNEGRVLKCKLRILNGTIFTEKILRQLLDYGEFSGLGQFRNGSYGRFEYELKKIK